MNPTRFPIPMETITIHQFIEILSNQIAEWYRGCLDLGEFIEESFLYGGFHGSSNYISIKKQQDGSFFLRSNTMYWEVSLNDPVSVRRIQDEIITITPIGIIDTARIDYMKKKALESKGENHSRTQQTYRVVLASGRTLLVKRVMNLKAEELDVNLQIEDLHSDGSTFVNNFSGAKSLDNLINILYNIHDHMVSMTLEA